MRAGWRLRCPAGYGRGYVWRDPGRGREAKRLFEEREGIDILPPAAVAVAALLQACEQGKLRDRKVLLNITGGGYERLTKDMPLYRVEPAEQVSGPDAPVEQIMKVLA